MPNLGVVDFAEVGPFLRDILETELAHLCTPGGFDAALMETLIRWNRAERFADTARAGKSLSLVTKAPAGARLLDRAMIAGVFGIEMAGRAIARKTRPRKG